MLGIGSGIAISLTDSSALRTIAFGIEPVGTLFINAIRMTVIPLVVGSLLVGVASMPDARALDPEAGPEIDWLIRLVGEVRSSRTELNVPPGGHAELCGPLRSGQQVQWRFEADAPVDFDLHYHMGQANTSPAFLRGASQVQGTLQVSVDESYCWMWANRGAEVASVRVSMQR